LPLPSDLFPAGLFPSDLVPRVIQIILIDLVLSADNAVVIGMAAHPLPPRQRRAAILIGGSAALALRVVLTAGAALLLGLPALKAIGGLLLLWIAYRLLEVEQDDANARIASTLRGAIGTILLADLVMSLDNVIGVAAASNGELVLLLFGLVVSMAIVMFGGGIFAELIDRLWWLAYVGALVIAWTGVDMVQDDSLVGRLAELPLIARLTLNGTISVVVVAVAHRAHRRQPARRQTAR
jgi:YjbE family integral membrane protein